MIMLAHDLEEAVYLAERVLVLHEEKDSAAHLIEVNLPRTRDCSEAIFARYHEELLCEFSLR